jgi:hypothetical protein
LPTVGPWRSWRTRHRAHRDLNCAWAADNPCDAAPSQWEARHRILAMFGCRWTTVKSCGLNDIHDITLQGHHSPLQPQSGRTDCPFGSCLLAAHDMISGLSPTRPPLLHVHVPTCQSFPMRAPLEPLGNDRWVTTTTTATYCTTSHQLVHLEHRTPRLIMDLDRILLIGRSWRYKRREINGSSTNFEVVWPRPLPNTLE